MGQVRAAASAPLLLLLALLLLQPARALYFLLGKDGAEKCFVEEMPAATMAVARYQNADWSPANDNYVHIAVKDIDDVVVHEQKAEVEGRFAFSSVEAGVYQVCLKVTQNATVHKASGGWGIFGGLAKTKKAVAATGEKRDKFKFHLSLTVGAKARNYNDLMKQKHLSDMEIEVLKVTDRLKDIQRELKYQNRREEQFRNTAESTNTRVMWWSILQMSIMLVSALFQSYHLKSFFEAKKLV